MIPRPKSQSEKKIVPITISIGTIVAIATYVI